MESTHGTTKLDYSTITNESLLGLSNCDMLLLSDIYSRCYSNKLNTSHTAVSESLDLALTFERVAFFKKILKDSGSFVSAAREYTHLVDSLVTNITECKDILDASLSRSNSATETIAKTLEFADKMALTQLISTEIIDKFHVLESYDSSDNLMSFDERIQKLTTKGFKCIESIIMAQNIISQNREYKALTELIDVKNLELDSICEQLFTQLQDIIREYSSGSPNAESFFETMYLKDCNLPFNKSFLVLSHRKIYLNYLVEHLILAKIKRLAHILSITRFDSINHLLAFAHEIREEGKGFINMLTYMQKSQKPLIAYYSQTPENTGLISQSVDVETPSNNTLQDNPLVRVLDDKLRTFTVSHHLKALRLLTFYINKYTEEPDSVLFFLEIFKKFRDELMKEFERQIDDMGEDFVRETTNEIETGPGLIICDTIDSLIKKFTDKYYK